MINLRTKAGRSLRQRKKILRLGGGQKLAWKYSRFEARLWDHQPLPF